MAQGTKKKVEKAKKVEPLVAIKEVLVRPDGSRGVGNCIEVPKSEAKKLVEKGEAKYVEPQEVETEEDGKHTKKSK